MIKKLPSFCLLFLLLAPTLLFPTFVFSQTIMLNSTGSTSYRDTQEYFTDIWGEQKNGNSTCQMIQDSEVFIHSVTSDVWSGVNPAKTAPDIRINPLILPGEHTRHYQENCSRFGLERPVDANKFKMISFKFATADSGTIGLLWGKNGALPAGGVNGINGFLIGGTLNKNPFNQFSIKTWNLPDVDSDSNPWSGSVASMTLVPSTSLQLNKTTRFDWIRLINTSDSPLLPFDWTTTDSNITDWVSIFVDENNSGTDGIAVARRLDLGAGGANTYDFLTGILEPGSYYFYAELQNTLNNSTVNVRARSAHLGPFVINGKPYMKFTSPSRTSGREYARDDRGNAWDMSQASDIDNFTNPFPGQVPDSLALGFHNQTFQNGLFRATSDDASGGTIVDTNLLLDVPANKSIATKLYRYFCHKIQIDSANVTRDANPATLSATGWVARFTWQRGAEVSTLGQTQDHLMYERSHTFPDTANGFITYCMDLWSDANIETGPSWRSLNRATIARYDPLEATPETNFAVDHLGLYAENETNLSRRFRMRWKAVDPEGDPLTIRIYYDDNQTGFNGTLLGISNSAAVNTKTGWESFLDWDATSLPDGTYYIYARLSDGTNSTFHYADVPVYVRYPLALKINGRGTPGDFDGDRKTDFTVIRRNTETGLATYLTYLSQSGGSKVTSNIAHADFDIFTEGDFDGDRLSDISFTRAKIQPDITWLGIKSASNSSFSQVFGVLGDVPVPADLDGDFIDDLTVFRDGTWFSARSKSGAFTRSFGEATDIPVPEDYDGDGIEEIGIWRPSTGKWVTLKSTKGLSSNVADYVIASWGLASKGDRPMPGDYDGDGKADIAIWRPSNGSWYICESSKHFASKYNNCAADFQLIQFGLSGDFPIKGDFDGDGKLDPAVWRNSDGTWYYKQSSNGQVKSKQWGLSTDNPLGRGILDIMGQLP